MKTLREEIEDIVVKISLRRTDTKQAVDDLLAQRQGEKDSTANPDAIRFKNQDHQEFICTDSFTVGDVDFEKDHHVAARPTEDGKVELENRESGERVQMQPATYEKVQAHLNPEWEGGEFDF